MTVHVYPNDPNNTHHVKLTDGVNVAGLILCDNEGKANPRAIQIDPVVRQSIKFYTGEQNLSDLEPPWQDVVMQDFSGGRGSKRYEEDTTRYWDGKNIDTTRKGIVLGPCPIFDNGSAIKANNSRMPGQFNLYADHPSAYYQVPLHGTSTYYATRFTIPTTFTGRWLYFFAKKVGSPTNATIGVSIAVDNVNKPSNSDLVTATCSITEELSMYVCDLTSVSLASTADGGSGQHWLIFNGNAADNATNHYVLITTYDQISYTGESMICATRTGTWDGSIDNTKGRAFYRIEADGKQFRAHFAELRKSLYVGAEYDDDTVSKVFNDGVAGTATAVAVNYVADTNNSADINEDNLNGAILEITQGTGSHLPTPYRTISDTVDATSRIYVSSDFPNLDTSSQYVTHGSDRWREITGHGLVAGQYITGAVSVSGAIYWACGMSTAVKRMRYSIASPYIVWTNEGFNATLMTTLTTMGATTIYWCNRTLPSQVLSAINVDNTAAAGMALTSLGAVNIGDMGEKITGLCTYGEEYPTLYVFKEGSIHRLIIDEWQELRISGMKGAADARNGYATAVSGVYLMFSFLDSIERYYAGNLDDIGINKNGSLPSEREGMVAGMCTYADRLYTVYDAGPTGTSSIFAYNGRGWHEMWRAPLSGSRIYGNMYAKPIPGNNVDRLYFSWNGNIISLQANIDPFYVNEATSNQHYIFQPGGSWESGWIHFGLEGVSKLFNAVTVNGDNLGSTSSKIYLDYRVDNENASWTQVGQFTFTNGNGKLELDPTNHNITGKRIQIRLRLETLVVGTTPRINSVVVEGLVTVPSKRRVQMTCRIDDSGDTLLQGTPEDIADVDTKLALLRGWASSAGTLGMSSHLDEINGLRIKLDYPSLQPLKIKHDETTKRTTYIMRIEAWVID